MALLLQPISMGRWSLPNRILMAPLTRCRADAAHVPTDIMVEHYAQRASAGLIIAEATMAMPGNCAFWSEPGIHSEAQVEGWRKVTTAVHARGGRIVLQIWHGGRACHPLMNDGQIPVAPSAIAITNNEIHTPTGKAAYVVPRVLEDAEIPAIIEGFAHAARNARAAGFDGVEVHGANGYLLDEFLRDGSNQRQGPYGGSLANRARLLLEVTEAVIGVWGADAVGVRISPLNSFNSMRDSDPLGLVSHVAAALSDLGIAYLHLMRADLLGEQHGDVVTLARTAFKGVLVGNMAYTPAEAEIALAQGLLDAVAFGRPFISNPDLVERIRLGAELAEPDTNTFYTPGPAGYIDYPTLAALSA